MEEDAPVILVVEDDYTIQAIVEDALSDGGFETEIVGSGEEAVKLLLSDPSQYRAVVTDINLTGELDGWAVARKAREMNPSYPVVYMTGADAEKWPINGVPNSILLN
jgi:DNA-binding response OmpR family regulator